jgi:hypothetical protein
MALEQYNFGAGTLTAVRNDIAVPTPRILGTLQDISVKFTFSSKALTGQYQDPVAIGRGARKTDIKAKSGKLQAAALNDLFFGGTVNIGQSQQVIGEGGPSGTVIPAAVVLSTSASTASGATLPFTSTTGVVVGAAVTGTNIAVGSYVLSLVPNTSVTLSAPITGTVPNATAITFGPSVTAVNGTGFTQDLGVFNALTGAQMTYVASAPAAGQYTVYAGSGTYVFSAADAAAGVAVQLSYRYNQTTTGQRITVYNQLMGSATYFQLMLTNQYGGNGLNLIFYKCVSTDISLDFKNEDFTIQETGFMPQANALGQFFDWGSSL